MKAFHPLFLTPAIVLACSAAVSAQAEIDRQLSGEIERLSAELAGKSLLHLPEAPDEMEAPPSIREAGPEFVEAWSLWRRVRGSAVRVAPMPPAAGITWTNAAKEYAQFENLLRRTIEANPPVDPSEYAGFFYADSSFCGDGGQTFYSRVTAGRTLALLRKGDYPAALRNFANSSTPTFDKLLAAYGVDPETYALGKWLGGETVPRDLAVSGSDRSARMLLRWAEVHGQAEVMRREKDFRPSVAVPFFPDRSIMQFLRPKSRASDETKAAIARFIGTDGLKLYPLEEWIDTHPRGSEPWLTDLAKAGLGSISNRTRQTSSRILTEVGIDHPTPTLRDDPLFRIFIDGKVRAGLSPTVNIAYRSFSYSKLQLDPAYDELLCMNGDLFFKDGGARSMTVLSNPPLDGKPMSPEEPWLSASLAVPPKFDGVNEIRFDTTPVTIQPVFAWKNAPDQNEATEIDFSREGPEPLGRPQHGVYHLQGSAPLVIAQVSPGDYWFRVRHSGAASTPWTKISVSKDNARFSPKLERGTTLVVPIRLLTGQAPEPADLRPDPFMGGSSIPRGGLLDGIQLIKDGREFTASERPLISFSNEFPGCAIFPDLPFGSYEIRYPAPDTGVSRFIRFKEFLAPPVRCVLDEKAGPVVKSGELVIETDEN